MKYAFVDVETTGFSPTSDRIIEIAIVQYENGKIIDTYQTLVNPEAYVSTFVQNMTGIDANELEKAPLFADIAEDVMEQFEDAIMVAHNVGFDYGFIKKEFAKLNYDFHPSRLCTVQLSRTLYPQYKRHGLDHVIDRFGLIVEDRHRALGDTLATVQFFELAREDTGVEYFEKTLKRLEKTAQLPSKIDATLVEKLPNTTGVYLFYGENGTLLYVGKSKNIRQRVKDHFYIADNNSIKFLNEVRDIDYQITAGEIGALILESQLIKEKMPVFNKKLRRKHRLVLAKELVNAEGYTTVSLEESSDIDPDDVSHIVGVYRSKKQAKEHFAQLIAENNLCDRFMGLQSGNGACFGYHLDRCKGACIGKESIALYNTKVDVSFSDYKLKAWPYDGPIAITERNNEFDISVAHILDKWCYLGSVDNVDSIRALVGGERRFEYDTYKILYSFIQKHPENVVKLDVRE